MAVALGEGVQYRIRDLKFPERGLPVTTMAAIVPGASDAPGRQGETV
jgi:hypothetical protein